MYELRVILVHCDVVRLSIKLYVTGSCAEG